MTASILLIRHAAHVHLDARLSGRMADVPLSDEGRSQAQALARALMAKDIERVECSPLERTRDTAAAIAAAAGLAPPKLIDALIEIDLGEWTGRAFGTFDDDPAWHDWNTRRGTARIPGGETMAEAQARIVDHLDALGRSDPAGQIALVTHSDMIRAAIAHVLGLPLDNLLRFDVAPASVSRIAIGDWGAKLLSLNERLAA